MSVLAIIPARAGSKGVPNKNFRELCGVSPVERATLVAKLVANEVVISTDTKYGLANWNSLVTWERVLLRPAALAKDDTPMIAVVKHVLEQIPGPPDQKIVLLQPTQPLRKPEHITQALALLTPEVSSVVSVKRSVSPSELLAIYRPGRLWRVEGSNYLRDLPSRRQDMNEGYVRDGTVYAFWRRTVEYGDIYGPDVVPLLIDPADTCPLDTPEDWLEAERRLRER